MQFSGRRLREKRLAAGFRPERVALDIARSAGSYEAYEQGRVVPPTNVLCALADVLGCEPGDFFEAEEVSA